MLFCWSRDILNSLSTFFSGWIFFSGGRTIIFTETKECASQLSGLLPRARPLHGDIQQAQREVNDEYTETQREVNDEYAESL